MRGNSLEAPALLESAMRSGVVYALNVAAHEKHAGTLAHANAFWCCAHSRAPGGGRRPVGGFPCSRRKRREEFLTFPKV